MLPGAPETVKPQGPPRAAVHTLVMFRLRSISPMTFTLLALVLVVACEVRVGSPDPTTTTGADDATSGTGATRPVGSSTSSGHQGGDPTRTEAVVTVGSPQGQGGAAGAGGEVGSGGDAIYQCETNFICNIQDDCVCPDCQNKVICTNPANCKDDGTCKPFVEGCHCADCASLDICGP